MNKMTAVAEHAKLASVHASRKDRAHGHGMTGIVFPPDEVHRTPDLNHAAVHLPVVEAAQQTEQVPSGLRIAEGLYKLMHLALADRGFIKIEPAQRLFHLAVRNAPYQPVAQDGRKKLLPFPGIITCQASWAFQDHRGNRFGIPLGHPHGVDGPFRRTQQVHRLVPGKQTR